MAAKASGALAIVVAVVSCVDVSCSKPDKAPPPPVDTDQTDEGAPAVDCARSKDQVVCAAGNWAATCDKKGKLTRIVDCHIRNEVCSPGLGCRRCVARSKSCGKANNVVECKKDGSGYTELQTCDAARGENCDAVMASCQNLCQVATQSHSYMGCEYWAVPTINSQLETDLHTSRQGGIFPFAVVIANPQAVDAQVSIERRGEEVASKTIKSGGVEVIELERIAELAGKADSDADVSVAQHSVQVKEGAYRISANVPVTVYQFNPLEYRSGTGIDATFSHTNDASLLLPTGVLTGNYVVVSRPTLLTSKSMHVTSQCDGPGELPCSRSSIFSASGFVAIVGVEETPTTVEITLSAHIASSVPETNDAGATQPSIAALGPGEVFTTTLAQGEVLQLLSAAPQSCEDDGQSDQTSGCYIDGKSGQKVCADIQYKYCTVGADYDLTGSVIRASGKVEVIGGHDCAFIPYNRWACDHLEETLFPLEAWGTEVFVSITEPIRDEPNVVRILSGAEGNCLTFTPKVHEDTTLNKGEYLEFEADKHFFVRADAAISVAQLLVGQDYDGYGKAEIGGKGDPSLSLAIPSEQWRTHYSFLAPNTFPDNYVNIIAAKDQVVLLDGQWVDEWNAIEGTEMMVAIVEIEGGAHTIESIAPFGIEVYGYASYTSYMYPGGLDLRVINLLL